MDTDVRVMIFYSDCGFLIDIGSKSSNPFTHLNFLQFTLMIFHILVIQLRIHLRDLLCSRFVLCHLRCLLLVICIAGQPLYPPLSLSYEYWTSVSMALNSFSLLWLEITLSHLARFLAKVPLQYDGLCILQFPRHFTPVSLLHKLHAVSSQVLILGSLSSVLMLLFSQVGFSLESLPCVFLGLD